MQNREIRFATLLLITLVSVCTSTRSRSDKEYIPAEKKAEGCFKATFDILAEKETLRIIRDIKMKIFKEELKDVDELKREITPVINQLKPHIETCKDITIYSSYARKNKKMGEKHVYDLFSILYTELANIDENGSSLKQYEKVLRLLSDDIEHKRGDFPASLGGGSNSDEE